MPRSHSSNSASLPGLTRWRMTTVTGPSCSMTLLPAALRPDGQSAVILSASPHWGVRCADPQHGDTNEEESSSEGTNGPDAGCRRALAIRRPHPAGRPLPLLGGRERTAPVARTLDQKGGRGPPDRLGLEQPPALRAGSTCLRAGVPRLRAGGVGAHPKLPGCPVGRPDRPVAGLQHTPAPRRLLHVGGGPACDLPGPGRRRTHHGRTVRGVRRSPRAPPAQDAGPVGRRADMRWELRRVDDLTADEQAALRTLSLAVYPPEVSAA